MKTPLRSSVRAIFFLTLAAIVLLGSARARAAYVVLQFTAAAGNISGNILTLNDPHLNGKPGLKLIVTQAVLASGAVFNNAPIGVFYDTTAKEWKIFNENIAAMPVGAIFNVLIPEIAQRVNGGATNSFGNQTFFNIRKHDSAAFLLQTHLFDPFPGITSSVINGVFQVSPIGLFFNPIVTTAPIPASSGHWEVFNENLGEAGAVSYNVADVTKAGVKGTPYSFLFTTSASNTTGVFAKISNPLTDGKPNAILFVNHIATTTGAVFNTFYGAGFATPSWGIVTEDSSSMPLGLTFVVTAFPSVTGS